MVAAMTNALMPSARSACRRCRAGSVASLLDGHAVEILLTSKGFSQFACRKDLFSPSENTTVAVLPNKQEKK
jgi:hypothetical protein